MKNRFDAPIQADMIPPRCNSPLEL